MPCGDVSNPASLYPQPAAAPPAGGSFATMNPLQVIATANYAQNYQNTQKTMAARQATGEAYQRRPKPGR